MPLLDITFADGVDATITQTEAPRAANLLSVQLAALEFSPSSGIDLRYFLQSEFQIQTASFKAYCVQRLLEQRVNVANVGETVSALFKTFTFGIGTTQDSGGFVA